jgi:AbrB family transcriptional regulator (stage V sporulation protein T)
MKATGIVRRIDRLGRVVIPKEICKTMGIRDGDPLEIYTEDNQIIFKKYAFEGRAMEAARLIHDLAGEMPANIAGPVREWAASIVEVLKDAGYA